MGRSSYSSKDRGYSHLASPYPRISRREEKRLRKEYENEKIMKAAAAARGPSPGQRIRRAELLAERAKCLAQFTALNKKINETNNEKCQLKKKYSEILAELDRIPAELSGSEHGMPGPGNDTVKEAERKGAMEQPEGIDMEKEAGGDLTQEEGIIITKEVGGVAVKVEAGEATL
ncbi:hypothetical protein V492_00742 [Pseudogymnoascus sp. VKM F-4246]|nr:hypothetical protein V492_00742 [Pseudogymnoascus sp. VKM F-4246]